MGKILNIDIFAFGFLSECGVRRLVYVIRDWIFVIVILM